MIEHARQRKVLPECMQQRGDRICAWTRYIHTYMLRRPAPCLSSVIVCRSCASRFCLSSRRRESLIHVSLFQFLVRDSRPGWRLFLIDLSGLPGIAAESGGKSTTTTTYEDADAISAAVVLRWDGMARDIRKLAPSSTWQRRR